VTEKRIPYRKWGHLLRFEPDEIEAWIEASRVPAAPAMGSSSGPANPEPTAWPQLDGELSEGERRPMASLRQKASGHWEARYRDARGQMHSRTFTTKSQATRWVKETETDVVGASRRTRARG
jgi:hypothetical protein